MENQIKKEPSNLQVFSGSMLGKFITISLLTILLLIPKEMINDLISERHSRLDQVIREVSSEWSGQQQIDGPMMIIPYSHTIISQHGSSIRTEKVSKTAMLFPEQLLVKGKLDAKTLQRGIFDVVVYEGDFEITGSFEFIESYLKESEDIEIHWDRTTLQLGITDLRGISSTPQISVNDDLVKNIQQSARHGNIPNGLSIPLKNAQDQGETTFKISIRLKGSSHIFFTPLGKTTSVSISGNWKDPGFTGNYLPTTRNVHGTGFNADWHVLHYNRPFGQFFEEYIPAINKESFGVNLLMPVSQYQQSMRTSKYGLLIIVLTFMSMFMMEWLSKKKIHLFQYLLTGMALVLFYALLLSLSEQLGFRIAYFLSSIATIGMLSFYAFTFFRSIGRSIIFCLLTSLFYAFIYILVREQDYALLIGSIGLFIMLGLVMYLSRNIQYAPGNDLNKD